MSTDLTAEVAEQARPYVPATLRAWGAHAPRHRRVEGTLVSADISGFTALSERLASFGREGAEELTVLLNRCFGGMIDVVDDHRGDVLKFGGDALLILFEGDDYIGSTVNLAARLTDLAEPGQLLAPKDFVSALMVNTEAIPVGPLQINGFPTPIEVVSLVPT